MIGVGVFFGGEERGGRVHSVLTAVCD